jgi:hypothetical protein
MIKMDQEKNSENKMEGAEWVASEKYEIGNNGETITKKIILPPKAVNKMSSKDIFDIVFKVIGVMAIFIPLLLLYFQKNNQINLDKRKALIECYTSLNQDLFEIENTEPHDSGYAETLQRIQNDYPVKLTIYANELIAAKVKELFYLKDISGSIKKVNTEIYKNDTAINEFSKAANNLISIDGQGRYIINPGIWNRDSLKILAALKQLNKSSLVASLNKAYLKVKYSLIDLVAYDSVYYGFIDKKITLSKSGIDSITKLSLLEAETFRKQISDSITNNTLNISDYFAKKLLCKPFALSALFRETHYSLDSIYKLKKNEFGKDFLNYMKRL